MDKPEEEKTTEPQREKTAQELLRDRFLAGSRR